MNKKILITSTDLMMVQFLLSHVRNLAENGFDVEVACSDVGGRMGEVRKGLREYVRAIHTVRLVRSPLSIRNLTGYRDMRSIVNGGNYDIIWTNEPVMGVVTRLAAKTARRKGTKVVYVVHGFHFYKGAPLINWMLFYPIECLMGRYCDSVVTINCEDFRRAKKMRLPDVRFIHGIGINTERLKPKRDQSNIRDELGINQNAFLVLSVGELNRNKNQQVIIRAITQINDKDIHYLLCGKGDQLEILRNMAIAAHIIDQVHFLGYRTDVVNICSQSDLFVMPSRREGLPVASLEAMYCGLPLLTARTRGLMDIMEDGRSGYMYDQDDAAGFAEGIRKLKAEPELRKQMALRNHIVVRQYCIDSVKREVLDVFSNE